MRGTSGIEAEPTAEGLELALTDAERSAFAAVLADLPAGLQHADTVDDLRLWQAAQALPGPVVQALRQLRRQGAGGGVLIVRNLPVDDVLPPTPGEGGPAPDKTTNLSEYALLTAMLLLGDPVGYTREKRGALVHDVVPVRGREQLQENTGSAYFALHTENAFHPHPPDYVGLLCLRTDHEGAARSLTASLPAAVRRVPAEDLAVLREPLFEIDPPSSFGRDARRGGAVPLLSGEAGRIRGRVDPHLARAVTPAAGRALAALREALAAVCGSRTLQAGDLLVIDNAVAVHGRSAFTPRYDGRDRWLQRCFVMRDLQACADHLVDGGHVLAS